MKFITFLNVFLLALFAQSQTLQMEIRSSTPAAPVQQTQHLEMVIKDKPDPNLAKPSSRVSTEGRALADCTECKPQRALAAPRATTNLQEVTRHLNQMNAAEWANACSGFVKNGAIGGYGEAIRSEMLKPDQLQNIKRGDQDLAMICPNYSQMNDAGKANVLLIIMTSMAFEESTCNNEITAQGPNGTLKGLFQLHLGNEASYGPECQNFDSNSPEGSIMCSLSILNKQMASGPMFRQESNYWDVLRPKRWNKKTKSYIDNPSYAQIRSAVSEYSPCMQRQSMATPAQANEMLFQVIDKNMYRKTITIEL